MKFLIFLLFLKYKVSTCDQLQSLVLKSPYNNVGSEDKKVTGEHPLHWNAHGSARVGKNFIRLTPDRQSKRGAVYSAKAIGVSDFTASLDFRISGQGKQFFGDGIGFWITNSDHYWPGEIHGFDEYFTGIGIIIDTFRNIERIQSHKDVLVLINDGQNSFEYLTEPDAVIGCDANLRYHAKRDDFKATEAVSTIKVTVNGTLLKIQVKDKDSEDFTSCVQIDNIGLPPDWSQKSHIGITASTGQLADNHDIISFNIESESTVLVSEDVEKLRDTYLQLPLNENLSDAALKDGTVHLMNTASDLYNRIEELEHELEHHHVGVKENIANLLTKLMEKEEQLEIDTEEIYKTLLITNQKVLIDSLDRYQKRGNRIVAKTKDSHARDMNSVIASAYAELNEVHNESNARNWMVPLLGLSVLVVSMIILSYTLHEKMKKMHII